MGFKSLEASCHLPHGAETLELGAMSGQIFETYAFNEVHKSYSNAGLRPPVPFFRNNDKKKIDLLLDRDGAVICMSSDSFPRNQRA